MGLQTTLFAQSNLPINSSHQPLKYRIAFIELLKSGKKKLGRPILFMIHRLNCQLT